MRTAHAPHRHRAHTVDIPKAERPRRSGVTPAGLAGGITGAFVGIILGYLAGVAAMWMLYGRTTTGVLPPRGLMETLLQPEDMALYTPLSIPLGFVLGGLVGERIGRRFGRASKSA